MLKRVTMRKAFVYLALLVVIAVGAVFFVSLPRVIGLEESDFACSAGAFVLHGTVMNSSFLEATTNTTGLNRSVNITAYNMSFANFGSKALTYINSTFTNETTGNFSLPIRSLGDAASDCSQVYVFTVYYYNTSQGADPRKWVVEEMGPSFPILPKSAITRFFDNSTIYLQPAATLNLSAINESHNISFNYAVFDNALGYPIAENFASKVFNATLVIQRNRNYSLMMMVTPDFTNPNSFSTAAPPQSVSLTNVSNYTGTNFVIQVLKNLSFSQFTLSGNISVIGNTTPVNVSNILVKLSFGGMLPPNSVLSIPNGISIANLTNVISSSSGSMIANYTTVVMGSSTGIDQVLEFYVSNTTSSTNNTQYFYAIQNFTVTASVSGGVANVTLRQLAGNFSTISQGGVSVPTAYVQINLTDSTGRPLSEAHSEVTVDNIGNVSGLGSLPQFRYMADQLTNGVLSLPLRLDSNATLKVFSRRYAPLQYKLNLTNASREVNGLIRVTVNTFKPEMRLSNGTIDDFSGAKGGNVKVSFMRNTFACNSPNATLSSCKIGRDFAGGNFDPLSAMFAGKTNLMMELNSTGVILQFLGVDMLASGPPDSSMSDSATSSQNGSSLQQAWRFGSVAPKVYDKVLIGVPYNQSLVTENATKINVTLKTLFDDSWNMVWNSSTDNISAVPSAWSDYNQTWFNVSRGGMPCQFDVGYNDTNFTEGCIVNTTTNYVWMVLLHFTGGDDNILQSDSTPPAAPALVNVSATVTGNVMINWTDVSGESSETYIVFRSLINISNIWNNLTNYSSNVTNLTAARIPEGVQTFTDNTTLNGSVFFYAVAAVDATGNLQNTTGGGINVTTNSYQNVTINDMVIPKVPANITLTTSDTSVTLKWLNVTQDVSGGADFHNLTYYIYRSAANETNVNLTGTVNVTQANISTFVKSFAAPANSTTVTGLVKGTYHFAVLTADDGGNQNLTVAFSSSGPSGNYGNVSVVPTVSSTTTTTTSSGGGGGGGGAAGTSEGSSVSKVWAVLPVGVATMKIAKDAISFTVIDFTVVNEKSNVELTVTKLAATPVTKSQVQGTVFQHIQIDEKNIKAADVSEAKIEFKVEKKWLNQYNGSIGNVALQRYSADIWTSLGTVFKRSDTTYNYFEATSPGLSLFAVVLKPAASVNEPGQAANGTSLNASGSDVNATQQAAAEQAAKAARAAGNKKLLVAGAVVAVIFAVGGFVMVRKKRGGGFNFKFPNPFNKFGGARPKLGSKSKSKDDAEAAEIVKEYESKRPKEKEPDERGRPPEAFN